MVVVSSEPSVVVVSSPPPAVVVGPDVRPVWVVVAAAVLEEVVPDVAGVGGPAVAQVVLAFRRSPLRALVDLTFFCVRD